MVSQNSEGCFWSLRICFEVMKFEVQKDICGLHSCDVKSYTSHGAQKHAHPRSFKASILLFFPRHFQIGSGKKIILHS